jgi:ubiquinone/menaquinone biosynthesis C-methylase UbiE
MNNAEYQFLAERTKYVNLDFMNYGYKDDSGFPIKNYKDKIWEYSLGLYLNLLRGFDLSDMDVLEIGSGRGGGTDAIRRYLNPKSIIGIDLNENNVGLASNKFIEGQYQVGDATGLQFKDNSFDMVVNVESSHCYCDIDKFFKEVKRILKPMGLFLYTDFRNKDDVDSIKDSLNESGLKIIKYEDITNNVVRSLSSDNERKDKLLDEITDDPIEKNIFAGLYAMKGTPMHRSFVYGDVIYYSMVMRNE